MTPASTAQAPGAAGGVGRVRSRDREAGDRYRGDQEDGTMGERPGRIYEGIAATIGETPLIRTARLATEEGLESDLLLKLEFFNPMASVKDRIGLAMIEAMEADGRVKPGSVIVEPTSGNTGIALAMVCASRGYRLILTMPESMSVERRKMLAILGAELVLTPKEEGLNGCVKKARELVEEIDGAVMPWQFGNPANPEVHRRSTAEEIWRDTAGEVDAVVLGIGTGGTITGVGSVLKARKPGVQVIAVEPADSRAISGGEPGPHMIQGIGPPFIPEVCDTDLIDGFETVENEEAFAMARRLAATEGIACGISSGAAVAAALRVAKREDMKGKTVVTLLPSHAERYISTPLFEGL